MKSMEKEKTQKDAGKEAAGKAAVDFVKDGMIVGLGTGTTTIHFIKYLAEKCRQGLRIATVATSRHSEELAQKLGIPSVNLNDKASIDLTVDGADEIDTKKRLIKGGGGALFHEKIIASMSKEMIVIADSSKLVEHLGRFPLAVEIASFAYLATLRHLQEHGYHAALRKAQNGKYFVTDGGNMIADIQLKYPCLNPEQENEELKTIPGVIETGFFFKLARKVVVGYPDGHIKIFDDENSPRP